jgi:protein KRI1
LKPDEVFKADDTDLNEFLSLKKLAPYRTTEKDLVWFQRWRKGGSKRRQELRKKLRETAAKESVDQTSSGKAQDKKKKRKRKHAESKQADDGAADSKRTKSTAGGKTGNGKRKRKSANDDGKPILQSSNLDKTRLAAYSTKKSKK